MENIELDKDSVGLYLMSYKGYASLKEIIAKGMADAIAYVVVSNDSQVEEDYYDEIVTACRQNDIKYFDRKAMIESVAKYLIAISWRWMINEPQRTLIVLHDSLLPKYRGFSPLVNQLINGEEYIGVTALFGEKEFDTGDIIYQASVKIDYPITIQSAIKEIAKVYKETIIQVLKQIEDNTLRGSPQNAELVTYSMWRAESDYEIDWYKQSAYLRRFVDAVGFPFKGATTNLNGERIRVIEVEEVKDSMIESRIDHIGKVLFMEDGVPVIVCGQGLIKIQRASYVDNNKSILPLKKFRSTFR